MKKTLLSFSIASFFILSNLGFASDCSIFDASVDEQFPSEISLLKAANPELFQAFPESAVQLALFNLQSYCCQKTAYSTTQQGAKTCQATSNSRENRENFPDSPYLFDHIYDILMRRRSDQPNNYPNFPKDQIANQWREKIEKLTLEPEWVLPTKFTNQIRQHRSLQPELLLPIYQGENLENFEKEFKNTGSQNILKSFTTRNLRTKYLNSCSIATYITSLLSPNQDKARSLIALQIPCKQKTESTISLQHHTLENTITYKANSLTAITLHQYGAEYFGQRSNALLTTLNAMVAELQGIVRQVTHLTPQCN